jgi:outer membrane receptor protein involved in Fe transport
MLKLRLLAAAAVAPMAVSAPVAAQDAVGVERITVTTQKRAQDAYDVPITLSALSGDTLEVLDVVGFDDLSDFVPGLTVQLQSPNNPGFVIRGITSDNGNFQDPPRVSVYLNGVDVSRSRGSAFELFDLERVEVAKGPQATLFGTAASVGAVSVITARPEAEFSAEAYAAYGNENYQLIGGYVTGGSETVQARFAMQYRHRDGYIANIAGAPGSNALRAQDDLMGVDTLAFRPSLRFTPSDAFTVDMIFNWERNTPPGTAFKAAVVPPTGGDTDPNTFAELGGAGGYPMITYLGFDPLFGPILNNVTDAQVAAHLGGLDLGLEREVRDLNVTAEWAMNDVWTATGVFGYREFESLEIFDADGTQAPIAERSEDTEGEQFSAELRFAFDNGQRVRGFFGANFFHEEGFQASPIAFDETIFAACAEITPAGIGIAPTCFNPDGSFNRLNIDPLTSGIAPFIPADQGVGIFYPAEFENTGDHDSLSVFADASFDLNEQIEITAGVRWVTEDRSSGLSTFFPDSFLILSQSLANPLSPPIFTPLLPGFANTNGEFVTASDSFDAVLPRFNVLYRVNDQLNLYGTVSKGRRTPTLSINQAANNGDDNPLIPGDANPPSAELTPEEIVWNYEAGFKAIFNGGQTRLNGSIFRQDYEDFRVIVVDLAAGGVNNVSTGEAEMFGVELEGEFVLSESLRILGNYAYIDAAVGDDPVNNGVFAGNRFRLQPEHAGAITVDYRDELPNGFDVFATGTYSYRSDVFFEAENRPIAGVDITEDAIALVNLAAGFGAADGGWEASVFIRNALDEDYVIDAGNVGSEFGSPTFIAGPPRLWGVELRARY